MRYNAPVQTRFANCHRKPDELPVQRGLAVTPRQMMEMAEQGIPISSVNAEWMYDDGMRNLEFEPPMERQRRVELGDLWETQQDVKKKTKKLFDLGAAAAAQEGGE